MKKGRAERVSIRSYSLSDKSSCLQIFDLNCPSFFSPNERYDYEAFLNREFQDYKVLVQEHGVIGAFGLSLTNPKVGRLRWILLHPAFQGKGLGSHIMTQVQAIAKAKKLEQVSIAASQHSAPFFAVYGAKTVEISPNGWGPGMHRHELTLRID